VKGLKVKVNYEKPFQITKQSDKTVTDVSWAFSN